MPSAEGVGGIPSSARRGRSRGRRGARRPPWGGTSSRRRAWPCGACAGRDASTARARRATASTSSLTCSSGSGPRTRRGGTRRCWSPWRRIRHGRDAGHGEIGSHIPEFVPPEVHGHEALRPGARVHGASIPPHVPARTTARNSRPSQCHAPGQRIGRPEKPGRERAAFDHDGIHRARRGVNDPHGHRVVLHRERPPRLEPDEAVRGDRHVAPLPPGGRLHAAQLCPAHAGSGHDTGDNSRSRSSGASSSAVHATACAPRARPFSAHRCC